MNADWPIWCSNLELALAFSARLASFLFLIFRKSQEVSKLYVYPLKKCQTVSDKGGQNDPPPWRMDRVNSSQGVKKIVLAEFSVKKVTTPTLPIP